MRWKSVVNFLVKEQYEKSKYDWEIGGTKVARIKQTEKSTEFQIDHLRIQKMLYFIYGLYYFKTKQKLFDLQFEAWPYGPVSRKAYFYIKTLSINDFIKNWKHIKDYDILDEDYDFRDILNFLNEKSTYKLVNDSHNTTPYESTKLNEIIEDEKILKYFCDINENENQY